MGGGLMQLVAQGIQDEHLTGNATITFFKTVYRRHSNYATETIEQVFNDSIGRLSETKKVSCIISRNGDLIHKVYLQIKLPTVSVPQDCVFCWLDNIGHRLVNFADVDIGGCTIDRQHGEFMHIWHSLTETDGHKRGFEEMIGNVAELTTVYKGGQTVPEYTLYVPLQFWFCRHAGLSIPLICLSFHEVKITVEFNKLSDCYFFKSSNPTLLAESILMGPLEASLFVDFVYLDQDERIKFARNKHEYLIDVVQNTGHVVVDDTSLTHFIKINFVNPCKELIWVAQRDDVLLNDDHQQHIQPFNFTDLKGCNPVSSAKLILNGQDRFAEKSGAYFNVLHPYRYHTSTPAPGVNVYSFAMRPEDLQPSGTCNFSKISSSVLKITFTDSFFPPRPPPKEPKPPHPTTGKVHIYAINYNLLRFNTGMAGLAYTI